MIFIAVEYSYAPFSSIQCYLHTTLFIAYGVSIFILNGPCYSVDQHSSHLPPRDGICTGCPVTSRRSCLSSNFGLIGPEVPVVLPASVVSFLIMDRKVQAFLLLLCTPYSTPYAGALVNVNNHNPWLALVFPLPRRRSLFYHPMVILYPPINMLFLPDNLILPVSTRSLVLDIGSTR